MFGTTSASMPPPVYSESRASSAPTWPRSSDDVHTTARDADTIDDVNDDPYELADAHGRDPAARLSAILHLLERSGFAKARANEWSAFDRILSGIAWTLQQLVPRIDSATRRVQWDALFQSHARMKPRLGFAQDVARCIDALPRAWSAPSIQPHQLLLQDFGDIGAVARLVTWLLEQLETPGTMPHVDAIRTHRRYLDIGSHRDKDTYAPLKADVAFVQQTFRPERKWQLVAPPSSAESESEDALIQRCLLEYGERVGVAITVKPDDDDTSSNGNNNNNNNTNDPPPAAAAPQSLMAQLANQAAAAAAAGPSTTARRIPSSTTSRSLKRFHDPHAAAFERQLEQLQRQAAAEQRVWLDQQRRREQSLLQHVVSAPVEPVNAATGEPTRARGERIAASIARTRSELHSAAQSVAALTAQQQQLEEQRSERQQHAHAVDAAVAGFERDLAALDQQAAIVTKESKATAAQWTTLTQLVAQNDALKRQRSTRRSAIRTEHAALVAAVDAVDTATTLSTMQDDEALRLAEIEQLHAHIVTTHAELERSLGAQTRAVQHAMRQIDAVPTRVELLQYEKRFQELADEVALTLDETRKHFGVYNTLQTTLACVTKETTVLESIVASVDVAIASKPATLAFFNQLQAIADSVTSSTTQQQASLAAHDARSDVLDKQYQLLLSKERAYVDALRTFQRECERNEALVAKLEARQK